MFRQIKLQKYKIHAFDLFTNQIAENFILYINNVGWLNMKNKMKRHLACLGDKVICTEEPKYM